MFCGVTSATCPLVDADAPLASDSDNPAAPKTGIALLRRLLFLIARFDMAQFSRLFGALNQSTPLRFVPLRPWRVRNRIGAADELLLTQIKDPDCDPVVGIMGRASVM